MFDKRGVVPRRRYDNPMDWLIVLGILIGVGIVVAGLTWAYKDNQKYQAKQKADSEIVVKSKRECLDYTLREYREGDAPQKCQVEVYGDQF